MAYPSSRRPSWRQLKPFQVLPIWTAANGNFANTLAKDMLARCGITDCRTYCQRLGPAIVICAVVGACIGVANYEMKGLIIGAFLGVAAPAFAIWFGTVLGLICIFMAVYCAAWAVILCVGWWILGAMFGG